MFRVHIPCARNYLDSYYFACGLKHPRSIIVEDSFGVVVASRAHMESIENLVFIDLVNMKLIPGKDFSCSEITIMSLHPA